jgi:hypothetical protein
MAAAAVSFLYIYYESIKTLLKNNYNIYFDMVDRLWRRWWRFVINFFLFSKKTLCVDSTIDYRLWRRSKYVLYSKTKQPIDFIVSR